MIAVYLTGGVSIPDFVKSHSGNWKPFRDLEFEILSQLASSQNLILDCGGGILFDQDETGKEIPSERKIRILKENAFIISLSRKSEYLIEKIQNDPSRPPLSSVLSYKTILDSRLPQYRAHSNIQIALDDRSAEEVCEEILRRSGWI